MTLTYALDENDCLTHQLFVASKSDRIRKRRRRSKLMALLYVAIAGYFYFVHEDLTGLIAFGLLAILWFFLYPLWEKRYYVNHYKGFIEEHQKSKIGVPQMIQINNDFIMGTEGASESKIATSEVEEICEIQSTFFIRLKGGLAIVIPKDKIGDANALATRLRELAMHLKVNYEVNNLWAWK